MGRDDLKRGNLVLNGTYGQPNTTHTFKLNIKIVIILILFF
jgi:hypothetical protein